MYTFMFVPPGLVFLLSLWGLLSNVRGFMAELKGPLFPSRRLLLCGVCLSLMFIGFAGMVWVLNLIMFRNADPTPVDWEPPWQ